MESSSRKPRPPADSMDGAAPPRVLCVGGTDPTGGAGLAADLRAVSALGGYAAPVVTAVTAQTSQGVTDLVILPASVVSAQLAAARTEPGVDAVKSGMLGSEDIVLALVTFLRSLRGSARFVLDPVFVSTSGRRLLSTEGVELLRKELLPLSSLVTPNLAEASALTGLPVETLEDAHRAADHLLAQGAQAVLLKGGHLPGAVDAPCPDLLRTADGDSFQIERPRRAGSHRGTGCFLASAIATGLAEGQTLRGAVERARDFLDQGLAQGFGEPGWPRLIPFVSASH